MQHLATLTNKQIALLAIETKDLLKNNQNGLSFLESRYTLQKVGSKTFISDFSNQKHLLNANGSIFDFSEHKPYNAISYLMKFEGMLEEDACILICDYYNFTASVFDIAPKPKKELIREPKYQNPKVDKSENNSPKIENIVFGKLTDAHKQFIASKFNRTDAKFLAHFSKHCTPLLQYTKNGKMVKFYNPAFAYNIQNEGQTFQVTIPSKKIPKYPVNHSLGYERNHTEIDPQKTTIFCAGLNDFICLTFDPRITEKYNVSDIQGETSNLPDFAKKGDILMLDTDFTGIQQMIKKSFEHQLRMCLIPSFEIQFFKSAKGKLKSIHQDLKHETFIKNEGLTKEFDAGNFENIEKLEYFRKPKKNDVCDYFAQKGCFDEDFYNAIENAFYVPQNQVDFLVNYQNNPDFTCTKYIGDLENKAEFLQAITSKKETVISGRTGLGKTTTAKNDIYPYLKKLYPNLIVLFATPTRNGCKQLAYDLQELKPSIFAGVDEIGEDFNVKTVPSFDEYADKFNIVTFYALNKLIPVFKENAIHERYEVVLILDEENQGIKNQTFAKFPNLSDLGLFKNVLRFSGTSYSIPNQILGRNVVKIDSTKKPENNIHVFDFQASEKLIEEAKDTGKNVQKLLESRTYEGVLKSAKNYLRQGKSVSIFIIDFTEKVEHSAKKLHEAGYSGAYHHAQKSKSRTSKIEQEFDENHERFLKQGFVDKGKFYVYSSVNESAVNINVDVSIVVGKLENMTEDTLQQGLNRNRQNIKNAEIFGYGEKTGKNNFCVFEYMQDLQSVQNQTKALNSISDLTNAKKAINNLKNNENLDVSQKNIDAIQEVIDKNVRLKGYYKKYDKCLYFDNESELFKINQDAIFALQYAKITTSKERIIEYFSNSANIENTTYTINDFDVVNPFKDLTYEAKDKKECLDLMLQNSSAMTNTLQYIAHLEKDNEAVRGKIQTSNIFQILEGQDYDAKTAEVTMFLEQPVMSVIATKETFTNQEVILSNKNTAVKKVFEYIDYTNLTREYDDDFLSLKDSEKRKLVSNVSVNLLSVLLKKMTKKQIVSHGLMTENQLKISAKNLKNDEKILKKFERVFNKMMNDSDSKKLKFRQVINTISYKLNLHKSEVSDMLRMFYVIPENIKKKGIIFTSKLERIDDTNNQDIAKILQKIEGKEVDSKIDLAENLPAFTPPVNIEGLTREHDFSDYEKMMFESMSIKEFAIELNKMHDLSKLKKLVSTGDVSQAMYNECLLIFDNETKDLAF